MNQKNKDSKVNQILSAFLVIAYVVCMYFFSNFIATISSVPLQLMANVAMYVFFGLLLFYATRVGEGKQIRRFSLSVLLLMVLPGIYIVFATFAPGLPLRSEITNSAVLCCLGYVMLGYGIPYTFFSGYELAPKEEIEEAESEETLELISQLEETETAEDETDEQAETVEVDILETDEATEEKETAVK